MATGFSLGKVTGSATLAPDVLGHDLLRRHLVEARDEDPLEAEVHRALVDGADVGEEAPHAAAVERPDGAAGGRR